MQLERTLAAVKTLLEQLTPLEPALTVVVTPVDQLAPLGLCLDNRDDAVGIVDASGSDLGTRDVTDGDERIVPSGGGLIAISKSSARLEREPAVVKVTLKLCLTR